MQKFSTLAFFLFFASLLTAQTLDHRWGEILVSMEANHSILDVLGEMNQHKKSRRANIQAVRQVSKALNIWLLRFDPNQINEYHLLDQVRKKPTIRMAQFNHWLKQRETIPNDPAFSQQWQWLNNGNSGKADADVDAELAWDITTGGLTTTGAEIVVAVLDDGTQIDHPDLADNHWVNTGEIPNNNFDDDGNGYIDDYHGWSVIDQNDDVTYDPIDGGHGIQVNGMLGAIGNNGLGVSGMNWKVKIMTIKSYSISDEATIIESYAYALTQRQIYNQSNGQKGAFVVATNTSWGFDNGNPANVPIWCAYYDTLGVAGILNCGATTNSNQNVDEVGDLPTTCPSNFLIGVGSSDNEDKVQGGFGPIHVDLLAPGIDVYTTTINSGYRNVRGTSFATPLVSGLVALLYAAPCGQLPALAQTDPPSAALLARKYLLEQVDKINELSDIVSSGGRANAFNSLQALMDECGNCIAPFAIEAKDLTANSANIYWSEATSNGTANLRWREAGSSSWNNEFNVSSPFELTGLTGCTVYQCQLQSDCNNTSSAFSPILNFSTLGCCIRPVGLGLDFVNQNEAGINWAAIPSTSLYKVRYRPNNGGTWTNLTATTNQIVLNDLSTCTAYEVQIQSDCDSILSEYSTALPFLTKGCGSCLDFPYCVSRAEVSTNEWIQRVKINTIDHESGNNLGYGNFTEDYSTDLDAGRSYPIEIEAGFPSFSFTEYFRVWVDFNLDGDFDDIGELAYEHEPTIEPINSYLYIPSWASEGSTRMRVSMRFGQYGDACETFRNGEVEDYCLNLIGGNGCPPPQVAIGENVDGQIVLNIVSTSTAVNNMQFRYRPFGQPNWSNPQIIMEGENTLDNVFEDCVVYECQFRSSCGNSNVGEWESTQFFKKNGCGSCQSNTYCASVSNSSTFEFIQNVQLNQLDYTSGDNAGYGDFTGAAASTRLGQGATYPISLTPIFPFNIEEVIFGVWIDFNQDGDFEDSDELVLMTDTTQTSITENISIPATAKTGISRMRIVMRQGLEVPSSCDPYLYGETEDYCVNIVEQDIDCNPVAPSVTSVTNSAISLNWNAQANAESYLIRYQAVNSLIWQETSSTTTTATISNLINCAQYQIQVAPICSDFIGLYSPPLIEQTKCLTATDEPEVNRFLKIRPNPASHYFLLHSEQATHQAVQVDLHALDGRLIQQYESQSLNDQLRFALPASLNNGIYILRVKMGTKEWVEKLVVQRMQ